MHLVFFDRAEPPRRHGRACHRKSGLPDLRHSGLRNSGKPEFRCHPRLALREKDVDARVISAFTRVFRRAMPAHDDIKLIAKWLSPQLRWREPVLALCLALATLGSARADYPDRSVRVIVPVAAGGGVDVMAR